MRGRTLLILVGLVVAGAVAAALMTVGGPTSARHARYDELRYRELNRLAAALRCNAGTAEENGALPETLEISALRGHCPALTIRPTDLTDDETGAPYRYERIDDRTFRVCGTFHDARAAERRAGRRVASGVVFSPETGCFGGRAR